MLIFNVTVQYSIIFIKIVHCLCCLTSVVTFNDNIENNLTIKWTVWSQKTDIHIFCFKKSNKILYIASYFTNNLSTLLMHLVNAGDEPIYTNTRPVANKQPSPRPRMQLHPLKTASSSQNFQDLTAEGRYEDGKRRNKHWQDTVQVQPQCLCFGMASNSKFLLLLHRLAFNTCSDG